MEKIKQIKPVGKAKTQTLAPTEQPTGFSVPLIYSENSIAFNEEVATGEMDGRPYTVNLGHDGSLSVNLEGTKGQMAKFAVKFSDLILLAKEAATRHDLLEPLNTEENGE